MEKSNRNITTAQEITINNIIVTAGTISQVKAHSKSSLLVENSSLFRRRRKLIMTIDIALGH
jgi:hypothetical protein